MIKGMKKTLAVAAAVAMAAGCLAGCGTKIDSTETVAVVGEEEVSMGVASLYTRYQQAQMYSMYSAYMGSAGMQIFDQVVTEDSGITYGDQMKEDVIDFLVNMYILKAHAEEMEVSITEEEEAQIAESAKSFVEANSADVMKNIGTSEEDAAELLRLYLYYSKMYDAMVADVDKEVSDEEAAKSRLTYVSIPLTGTEMDEDGNYVALTDAEILEKQIQAQEVLDKVISSDDAATADMDALAKEVDDTLSAVPYTYDENDSYLDAAVLEAVEGLTEGEVVNEVVEGSDGSSLYVVRFDTALDREATDQQKENIISQREQEAYEAQLKEWKDAADYEVKADVWDKISITDNEVYTFKAEETTAE